MSDDLVSACLWPVTDQLIESLLERFGEPVDGYVNGSQVWLRDEPLGQASVAIEYRLHPIARFKQPAGQDHHTLFVDTLDQPSPRELNTLWDGLEAFSAYGDEIEPQQLSSITEMALRIAPELVGLVNHERIGDEWQNANGAVSISQLLRAQLTASDSSTSPR
jgi:hypothetical protein